MKEIIIDEHHWHCDRERERLMKIKYDPSDPYSWPSHVLVDLCCKNPKRLLFMAGNKFYLINYFHCMEFGGRLDFIQDLINKCVGEVQIFPRWEVERVCVNHDLKEYRIRGKILKKYIQQVNYLYEDAARKEYAITTRADYFEAIENADTFEENYNDAKAFLKKKKYLHLLDELSYLAYYNRIDVSDYELVRSVDSLVKKININIKQTTNGIY